MFDTLLSLPLFQGLGHADLTRILESTRLEFQTLEPQTVFLRQGVLCTGLTYLLEGNVQLSTLSADRRWSVEEELAMPTVVGADVLYGSARTYAHSYQTLASTRTLFVDKRTVAALTSYFEVFRINLLNLLSTSIDKQRRIGWLPARPSLEGRIIHFFLSHCQRPAGHKVFHLSQRVLGSYLGEDYRYISKALHALEHRELVRLERNSIDVPALENLLKENI